MDIAIGIGVISGLTLLERLRLGLSLGHCDAGSEMTDHAEDAQRTVLQLVTHGVHRWAESHPKFVLGSREMESAGHYTDDRVHRSIQIQRLSEDVVAAAKSRLPKFIAKQS